MPEDGPARVKQVMWRRHANPWSGWTRVPTGPVLIYALYRRNWRLLVAALAWTAINPFLFSPPDTEDAWMTRAVLAERWWIHEEEHRTVGLAHPNRLNTAGAIAFLCALAAAWRRRPAVTTLATALAVALKFWWLRILVRQYDAAPAELTAEWSRPDS